jgi:hypothetical protein
VAAPFGVVVAAAFGGVVEVVPLVPPVVDELLGEAEFWSVELCGVVLLCELLEEASGGVVLVVPVVELLLEGEAAVLPPILFELPVGLAGLV